MGFGIEDENRGFTGSGVHAYGVRPSRLRFRRVKGLRAFMKLYLKGLAHQDYTRSRENMKTQSRLIYSSLSIPCMNPHDSCDSACK